MVMYFKNHWSVGQTMAPYPLFKLWVSISSGLPGLVEPRFCLSIPGSLGYLGPGPWMWQKPLGFMLPVKHCHLEPPLCQSQGDEYRWPQGHGTSTLVSWHFLNRFCSFASTWYSSLGTVLAFHWETHACLLLYADQIVSIAILPSSFPLDNQWLMTLIHVCIYIYI